MTKICLSCNKEYDDNVEYCPDCLARSREINKKGNIFLSMGFVFVLIYTFMHNIQVIISLESNLDIPEKIVASIGCVLIMVGIVTRNEAFHSYDLIEAEKYNNKIFVKRTILRFIRYLILTVITIGSIFLLLAY